MRVTLHDYATDPDLPQKDGVNLAHEDIKRLLQDSAAVCNDIDVVFHDFLRLCRDPKYALEMLSEIDCVVSNVGPHAHYYFYLREKYKLNFRIIRDVRTAFWSSYLLQEYLCQSLLRPSDCLLVSSHYTRAVYENVFPHLRTNQIFRCYPLTTGFPEHITHHRPVPKQGESLVLGYIGRLSEDKNFPQVIELLIRLNKIGGGQYRLIACGDIHSESCQPQRIRNQLKRELGSDLCFQYKAAIAHSEIWSFFNSIDLMLFPSTSNLETLGRVLVEASYAQVPVIAAEHAATTELLPVQNLCPVSYNYDEVFEAHYDHCLGIMELEQAVEKISCRHFCKSDCYGDYAEHPSLFLSILRQDPVALEMLSSEYQVSPSQQEFVNAIELNLPAQLSKQQAMIKLALMIEWFVTLQDKESDNCVRYLERLVEISAHRERTERYIQKSSCTRADFTNVGGIDIELCHLIAFYPEFKQRRTFMASPAESESIATASGACLEI